MDRELALEIIRERCYPEAHELPAYQNERRNEIDRFQTEEEVVEDFELWKEHTDLEYEKIMDRNYWASIGGF